VEQAMGSSEDAIIALCKSQALRSDDEADLASAYRKIGQGDCAVRDGKPNQGCPLVRAHRCKAQAELEARVAESGLPEDALRVRQAGCGTF
jgi:hypothetical protein